MSTYFKTAAMTLLSKTLQTFLYKYLLDVDVEGVNMPSFMGDVDAGWGVRLCNVRLREGVELMNLPGKKKKSNNDKEKKTRRKERAKDKSSSEPQQKTEDSAQQKPKPTTSIPGHVVPNVDRTMLPTPRQSFEEAAMDASEHTIPNGDSSRPPTPDMKSKSSSMFGCFVRERAMTADDGAVETPSAPPSSRGLSPTELEELRAQNGALEKALKESDVMKNQKDLTDSDGVKVDEARTRHAPDTNTTAGSNTVDDNDIDNEDDDGDFVIAEDKDMILRLGNGGRIGTLDVRLVGKELHVSVEDAFLVIEACPKPEVEGAAAADSESQDGTKPDASKVKPPPEKPKPPPKKKDEATTVGEKIMENSTIARLLTTIPHLFLRDCRVQIIHRARAPTSNTAAESEITPEDSVVEIGVELLSVTSGEDILAHIRMEEEHSSDEAQVSASSSAPTDESADQNEYLVKRIRTGRGPEGGIWVKVFPPGTKQLEGITSLSTTKQDALWANERWTSTLEYCFFRCSGLDVRARIYLGKREEVSENEWALYDEFTIDTMLYTVDYIAPGPSPALPPLDHAASTVSDVGNLQTSVIDYQTDKNGIQSSRIPSNFHRVARGFVPSVCNGDHLPCETCAQCWEIAEGTHVGGKHSLDSSTPLPGLAFSLSLKDPLEVNVDRPALEVLGDIINLFSDNSKKPESDSSVEKDKEMQSSKAKSAKRASGAFASLRDVWSKKEDAEENIVDSFPSYMQPECIEFLGVHVTKLVARIHVMRANGAKDSGRAFCYWDTVTRCITMDLQSLTSEQKTFQDVRFDVGEFNMTEYRGTVCNSLVSLGLSHPDIEDSDSASNSSNPRPIKYSSKPAWPNTAALLLNIRPPLETIHYESRERHGLQMRYMSLSPPPTQLGGVSRSHANIRVGVMSINMPYEVKDDISNVIGESMASLFGRPEEGSEADAAAATGDSADTDSSPSSLMKYKFQVDGGSIQLAPLVSLKLPLTKFTGGRSSETGIFFETLLNHLALEYGERPPPTVVASQQQLSLSQMAALPEKVRMRCLLFLKDLGPLERALGIKKESNTFLRCRAVNKGFVKQAKRAARAMHKQKSKASLVPSPRSSSSRRQELLSEIMKLDDSTLESLLQSHQKSERRHRKTRSLGHGGVVDKPK